MLLKEWKDYGVTINSDEDFVEDNYPTDTAIAVILLWPATDYKNLFAFIRDIWHYADWGWNEPDTFATTPEEDEPCYRISTGGWSGNEDIIRAMKDNRMFWILHWMESRRGGHYKFDVPTQ